jgi:hypothetical protein
MHQATSKTTKRTPRMSPLLKKLTRMEEKARQLMDGLAAGEKLAANLAYQTLNMLLGDQQGRVGQLSDGLAAAKKLASGLWYEIWRLRKEEGERMAREGNKGKGKK